MTPYQVFLLVVLIAWPATILAVLLAMSRLEEFVRRTDAGTPREAGLEPVAGGPHEREVRIVFGDRVVGEPD